MKLAAAISLYMQVIRAGGCKGDSIHGVLVLFAKYVGSERELSSISQTEVRAFLDGNLPISRYWHRKHSALVGFSALRSHAVWYLPFLYLPGHHVAIRISNPMCIPRTTSTD